MNMYFNSWPCYPYLPQVLVCVFGAAVNGVSNNGWTALHYSAFGEHPELVRWDIMLHDSYSL